MWHTMLRVAWARIRKPRSPCEGLAGGADEYTRGIYRQILESDVTTPEHKEALNAFMEKREPDFAAARRR